MLEAHEEVEQRILTLPSIKAGSFRFYHLRHVAHALEKTWPAFRYQIMAYHIGGFRFGWHWYTTRDELKRWLVEYPHILLYEDQKFVHEPVNPWAQFETPVTVIESNSKFYATPLEISRAMSIEFPYFKDWMLTRGLGVTVDSEITAREAVIDIQTVYGHLGMSTFQKRTRKGRYSQREITSKTCSKCEGVGRIQTNPNFPMSQLCPKCKGTGQEPNTFGLPVV